MPCNKGRVFSYDRDRDKDKDKDVPRVVRVVLVEGRVSNAPASHANLRTKDTKLAILSTRFLG